jgi:hypothetical protein
MVPSQEVSAARPPPPFSVEKLYNTSYTNRLRATRRPPGDPSSSAQGGSGWSIGGLPEPGGAEAPESRPLVGLASRKRGRRQRWGAQRGLRQGRILPRVSNRAGLGRSGFSREIGRGEVARFAVYDTDAVTTPIAFETAVEIPVGSASWPGRRGIAARGSNGSRPVSRYEYVYEYVDWANCGSS